MTDPSTAAPQTSASESPVPSRRRVWLHLPRRRSRRYLFLGVYVAFCVAAVVAGERLFWWFRAGVPLGERARIWDMFYPEIRLSKVEPLRPRHADGLFDVLLLGGSVMMPDLSPVEGALSEHLRDALGGEFRIFNLARQAHTSRDSMLKYSRLEGAQFDLVILYDGINDVRMNRCTREEFRDDYTHFGWYYGLQKRLERGEASLPVNLAEQAVIVRGRLHMSCLEGAVEEGRDIKTVGPVRRNTEQMIATAAERGDAVLLQTFAYCLPADYSAERLAAGSLGYAPQGEGFRCAVENWGKPEYVLATIDAQNAALREVAAAHPEVLFVDQDKLMPPELTLYADVCHLSKAGARRFVDNLWPAVEQRIALWKAERERGRARRPPGTAR